MTTEEYMRRTDAWYLGARLCSGMMRQHNEPGKPPTFMEFLPMRLDGRTQEFYLKEYTQLQRGWKFRQSLEKGIEGIDYAVPST